METILEQIISAYKIKCPLFICLPKKLLYQIRNLTVNLRATKKIIFISGAKCVSLATPDDFYGSSR